MVVSSSSSSATVQGSVSLLHYRTFVVMCGGFGGLRWFVVI